MRTTKALFAVAIAMALGTPVAAEDVAVQITAGVGSVDVMHGSEKVTIMRNQDQENTGESCVREDVAQMPAVLHSALEAGPRDRDHREAEVIRYAKSMSDGDGTIVLIDSRTPDWVDRGTIPSAMNVPWTKLNPAKGADPISIAEIMEGVFNVKSNEELMDFSDCKTAVMFCNGMWCGQSPNNIQNLLKFGYPAHKIKWYRGGMQDWEILGLTTVPGG